jgi:hypothetical protein
MPLLTNKRKHLLLGPPESLRKGTARAGSVEASGQTIMIASPNSGCTARLPHDFLAQG